MKRPLNQKVIVALSAIFGLLLWVVDPAGWRWLTPFLLLIAALLITYVALEWFLSPYIIARVRGLPLGRRRAMYILAAVVGAAVGIGYWYTINVALNAKHSAEERAEYGKNLKIMFKDSPLLTPEVREFQTNAIGDYFFYFKSIGIDVPLNLPPIGVLAGVGSGSTGSPGGQPYYVDHIWIGDKKLLDRKAVIDEVGNSMFRSMLTKSPVATNMLYPTFITNELNGYFVFSFLGHKPENEGGGWIDVLWTIRSRFGQQFADHLAAFTFRSIADDQRSIKPVDPGAKNADIVSAFNRYFYYKLLEAEHIVDNDDAKLEDIKAIVGNSSVAAVP